VKINELVFSVVFVLAVLFSSVYRAEHQTCSKCDSIIETAG
jgi:hypothetical protein